MAYSTYFPNPGAYSPYGGFAPQQNFPMQPQQMPQTAQQPQRQGFLCLPVTSKQEAEVYQIPFDGSTVYFVDTSSGNLYAKTFDFNTGKAPVTTYAKEEEKIIQYATMEDIDTLRAELEAIKKPRKKAVTTDEPDE